MRKPLIAANWKLNKNLSETRSFIEEFKPLIAGHDKTDVLIAAPYTVLYALKEGFEGTDVVWIAGLPLALHPMPPAFQQAALS